MSSRLGWEHQNWPFSLRLTFDLRLRVSTTAWRSCVRPRRVGPSLTKSSATSSAGHRRWWCRRPTGRSCSGERRPSRRNGVTRVSDNHRPCRTNNQNLGFCSHVVTIRIVRYFTTEVLFFFRPGAHHSNTVETLSDVILDLLIMSRSCQPIRAPRVLTVALVLPDVPTSPSPKTRKNTTNIILRTWKRWLRSYSTLLPEPVRRCPRSLNTPPWKH